MQENFKIDKLAKDKFKLEWGEGLNASIYLSDDDILDFINTIDISINKMTDRTRPVKTEQIGVSKLNLSHRIWSYKNRMIQIEWGTLIKKIPLEELQRVFKNLVSIRTELEEQRRKEEEIFQTKLKIVTRYYMLGMVSLFFAVAFTAILIAFIFFVMELAIYAGIICVASWGFFVLFFYLQQENVKLMLEYGGENLGESVIPVLSNIPNNRRVVEMLTIFFIVFVFMAIYFSKTIPVILQKFGDPAHGINF
ncbi:MAG: hypothetical protein WC002_07345 [Candidatus Muiribacteriota bacterium]